MKKLKRFVLLSVMSCLAFSLAVSATGCGGTKGGDTDSVSSIANKIANYHGENTDSSTGKMDFNDNLFYRNDYKVYGPDPFVLDNTERDGYYYVFKTEGKNGVARSKNLMQWEELGSTLALDSATEKKVCTTDIWAPEVIYEDGTYYMFFSATPAADTSVSKGGGVDDGSALMTMMMATSDSPAGPYHLVNFLDPDSCGGEENVHDFNRQSGLVDENGDYLRAWPHYYAGYMFLSPDKYTQFANSNPDGEDLEQGGYTGAIDPHPFVDSATGKKYFYWSNNIGHNTVCVVEMENWYKPLWDTAKVVLSAYYYNVEDWLDSNDDMASYDSIINEGPEVMVHNGKYYLTYSTGTYSANSYKVIQAVSDSPTGPFRKLEVDEGGILLSSQIQGSGEISGTGHHSFITVGDKLYIVYHRHDSFVEMGSRRNVAIDEVKWLTVKDKNGENLDVMYVNGPTSTLQPAIEEFSKYKNIASKATVTASADGVETSYLTDGYLSHYKNANTTFTDYVKETEITENTTFTFKFDSATTVCAVMLYVSRNEEYIIKSIKSVEFDYERNGEKYVGVIENIPLSKDMYQETVLEDYNEIFYVTPCAAIFAEFNELNVTELRISVELENQQARAGISEIVILGKDN